MNRHPRVLVMEPNRYQALLIERELYRCFPDVVISVFRSRSDAEQELHACRYSVAVVSLTRFGEPPIPIADCLRSAQPGLPLVFLLPGDRTVADRPGPAPNSTRFVTLTGDFSRCVVDAVRELVGPTLPGGHGAAADNPQGAKTGAAAVPVGDGSLAHEVNNPLQTIMGTAELLLESNRTQDRELMHKLAVIKYSAGRIRASLDRLAPAEPTRTEIVEPDRPIDTHR